MRNLESFLEELTQLTQKYNIVISGCGCCGSPLLDSETRVNHHKKYKARSHSITIATDLTYE